MFKEVAVEPHAVAASFLQFKYVVEKFGIPKGRLIAAFPSKWKRRVYEAAQARLRGTTELARIEVSLKALPDKTFYARGRSGQGCDDDWLKAALEEHRREPFDGIIGAASSEDPAVVAIDELDEFHPFLEGNSQWHIRREAQIMAQCCEPLLSRAKHVKLVDPHFDAGKPRFRRPFFEFLQRIKQGARIDVFRRDMPEGVDIVQRIEDALNARPLAQGTSLHLYLMPSGSTHNRYVLTEEGGVQFHTGLDDQGSGELVNDDVGPMETAVWQLHWNGYKSERPFASWFGA